MVGVEIIRNTRKRGINAIISFMFLLLSMVLLIACGSGQEIDDAQVTVAVVQEVEITKAVEIDTADGPAKPTESSFYKYTSQDAIDAFVAAGLEADNPVPLELDGHSPLPPTFVEAQRFQMPALEGRSGRIFSFESEGELQMVRDYYEGFTGAQANIVIVSDNLLLQISADAPEELADAYRAALETLR